MAVYQYTGTMKQREDFTETGTVLARTEDEARQKLKELRFKEVRLKKLTGLHSLIKQFSPDIR